MQSSQQQVQNDPQSNVGSTQTVNLSTAPGIQVPYHQQQQQQQQANQTAQSSAPPQQLNQQSSGQQHYPHQGLNGGWQSDRDYQERRRMIAKIVSLLQQRKPNAPEEWLRKLPQMAKRLEESLYRSARSFDEYKNESTLKHRLQQLAYNIGLKSKRAQGQVPAQAPMQAPPPQPQMQPLTQGSSAPPHVPAPAAPSAPTSSTGQRIVNIADVNPNLSAPVAVAPQGQGLAGTIPIQEPSSGGSQGGASRPAGSDRQQVLRHQQQRLLLLRHAAKCQHEDGKCPVTPHCAGMKRLWKHIAECKNQKCAVPHCVSSRYVLSHYHRCKDVRCPVCGPVREAIHRSHEKQKQMQALKQRHQDAIQQKANQPVKVEGGVTGAIPVEPPNKRQKVAPMQQRPLAPPGSANIASSSGVRPYTYGQAAGRASAPSVSVTNGQVVMPKHEGPKVKEDHTLINSFSIEQIEMHIAALNNGIVLPPPRLKAKCGDVLRGLQQHQHGWVFNTPVDPVELGLPDYFEVVRKPMDLGTIRKKLENGVYTRLEEFEEHTLLTFNNAMLYNPEGTVVWNMAKEMKDKFQKDWKKLLQVIEAEEDVKRRSGEACMLCGCEKLLFEPPVFYCNGANCPSKRIRRNSYYYVAGNNQYHWCHQCFQDLRDNTSIDLGDVQVKKEALVKKKNDEVHEESWVQCDRCERWVHQICALFNTRQNKHQGSEYACPKCTIEERRKNNQIEGNSTTPQAEDLPRTKLSEYLENHVRIKVEEFLNNQASDISKVEGIPKEVALKKIQMGGAITIRQVTSMDRRLDVRDRMKKRYAFKNYPDEFNFRCKCIVVFQNLDGVDVMLFGLYVYEHDEKNPAPNTRAVYVSYLDSVYYMRPRRMRTFIYHEILISYLDYVRRRGFATAHIWACPPLKGDDYILYAKPEDQKIPKDDRLRQWYIDMLVECQRRGVVGKVTNMYDLYFADEKNDATVVPYMEGDYFPAEVENIIKDIEEGKSSKKKDPAATDKKAKQKKKAGRQGTRSGGLDEDALHASGMLEPGKNQKSLEAGARDYVMAKLGETIQPMKDSFIVAFLAWEGAEEANMEVPPDIQKLRDEHNITWKIEHSHVGKEDKSVENDRIESSPNNPASDGRINGTDDAPANSEANTMENDITPGATSEKEDTESRNKEVPVDKVDVGVNQTEDVPMAEASLTESEKQDESTAMKPDIVSSELNDIDAGHDSKLGNNEPKYAEVDNGKPSAMEDVVPETSSLSKPEVSLNVASGESKVNDEIADGSNADEIKSSSLAPAIDGDGKELSKSTDENVEKKSVMTPAHRQGKFAAMQARKRDLEGMIKKEEEEKKKEGKDAEHQMTVKDSKGRTVKVIDDDEEELDCEFLNNRQAFLNLCQGNHYQFDSLRRAKHTSMMVLWHLHNRDAPKFVQQCATCSREILTGYRLHCPTCTDFDQCQDCFRDPRIPRHPHQLKPIPVSGQQSELTEAQRKERQRSIQLHMTLLLHAATCNSAKCPSANCTKMKGLLKHGSQCSVKVSGGCNVCKRIWALLQIHARQCKAQACPVPNCMAIRERVRQLKKQQQAMDDRRRLEMNRAYGR